jgi:iron uptake system EfeUOB component EfeO/EfeM
MVQGGSGGQAVSNADFQVVLQSFQSGTIGNLEAEDNIFKMLQGMTEREYLHSYINTQKSLLEGAAPTQNAARYYLEQHRQSNTSMSNIASFAEAQKKSTMNFNKARAEYEAKRQAKLKEVTQKVTGRSGR